MRYAQSACALATALAVALLAATLDSPGAQATAPPPRPTFGQPTISGIQGVGFEQDLRLDPTNPDRAYTSVPGSLSSDTSWIWHSEDAGKTFKWVTSATPKEGKVNPCAGGGDTELAVDTAGNLYFNDLTLANFSTARSPDHGATFACSNTGVPDAAVDRQWYAIDGDPTTGTGLDNGAGHNIYLVNDEIGPGNVECPVSGVVNNVLAMYRSPLPGGGAAAGIQFGPAQHVSAPLSCDEGIMGNDEVSPIATTTDEPAGYPAVKHVYVIHDDATLSRILIGRCYPVPYAQDPSGLQCRDLPVATLGTIPSGGSCPTAKTGANFPTMAIDSAGNLYAVWSQAPQDPNTCQITGNTVLKYSYSTNEGTTWSAPATVPTPGLRNNVFPWLAAGDNGRVDVAWYGTPTPADPANPDCGTDGGGHGGPDATTNGIWSLYLAQTLNGHAASPTFTTPILAGEHHIHKGTIQTLIGGQCGDRTLGDFLQLRVGSMGEAQIAYADSNNADEPFAPHGMYVKQNGGSSVSAASPTVSGDAILINGASDPSGDGKRENAGVSGPNMPAQDILDSSFSQPSASDCHPAGTPCYRVKMTVNNLSLAPPAPDADSVWQTQWLVPAATGCTSSADSCHNGGKNPFVYFESNGTCWSGQNAALLVGGGVTLTYPGETQITASGACSYTLGPLGRITIDVPIADVSLDAGVAPLNPNRLFSVTASTMTLIEPAETNQPSIQPFQLFTGPIGGDLFDLIDVVRAYDASVDAGGGGRCHSTHGDGHITGRSGAPAHFTVDADNCNGNHGQVSHSDTGHDFQSSEILSVGFDDVEHTVTIVGLGEDNGEEVGFTAVELDGVTPLLDAFQLTLSNGYWDSGPLLDGAIDIN